MTSPASANDTLVDRRAACAVFGVSLTTWVTWTRDGRVPRGDMGTNDNGHRGMLYTLADLLRLKAEWESAARPSPHPTLPEVWRVPVVTRRETPLFALIDAADRALVEGKRWNYSVGKNQSLDVPDGTVVLAIKGTPKPSLSRLILGDVGEGLCVAHVNGDRLDCRRQNLVLRTRAGVARAKKKVLVKAGQASSSRFKGVVRTESGRKYSAAIAVDGVVRKLGRFRSEVDAALAYDAAARELFGVDAFLNLPDLAEADRLRALEPTPDDTWPPEGMIDRHAACEMFDVSLTTWMVWERKGRITCGQFFPLPDDKPGRCKLYALATLEADRVRIERLRNPYPDPDRPGVYCVPLKSRLAHREALIDADDLPVVAGRNWNWGPRSDRSGTGVVVLASMKDQTPLHRLIVKATDASQRVSFANGDPLDCRRANLIVRTPAQVARASGPRQSTAGRAVTSTYKGVSADLERNNWVVQIRRGGVPLTVGRFDTETEAAEAYDDFVRALFGPGAFVNFPTRSSSATSLATAQEVIEGTLARARGARRRQRQLEQALRRAAAHSTPLAADEEDSMTLSSDTARQLFDVTPTVWQRWARFRWLPATTRLDDTDEAARMPLAKIERLLGQCGLNVLPYPDPQRPGVWRLPLCGETARGREALIDADAVPFVRTRRWRFAKASCGRGGEVQSMNPAENIRLHYVVMGKVADPGSLNLCHRNDDPLDCRRENLLERDHSDKNGNKRKQATFRGRPCTSQFKGVFYEARRERWVASIKKEGVQYRLGSYRDEIAAAQRYDEAARDLFGEHARPNFPHGVDPWLALQTEQCERNAA